MNTQDPLELLKQMNISFDPQNLVYYAGNGNNYTAVELLLKAGMDVDSAGKEGTNALWNATMAGKEKTMKLLIVNGANVNALTSKGYSPLLSAIYKKYQDKAYPALNIINILLENKANPEIKAEGISAMAIAAKHKDTELMELLKSHGAKEITLEDVKKVKKEEKKENKKLLIAIAFIVIAVTLGVYWFAQSSNNSSTSASTNATLNNDRPVNPVIQTDYGQVGEYKTMDEYYLDNNGNKVWHGYRKTLYPNGMPKAVEYDQYGQAVWYETYDEAGNVLSSTKK